MKIIQFLNVAKDDFCYSEISKILKANEFKNLEIEK